MAFVKQLPRNILEMCAISLTIISIIVLIWRQGFENVPIALFSVYALAGFRIIPAIQTVFSSCATLQFVETAIDRVTEDFEKQFTQMPINNGSSTLNHNHDISLRKVSVEHKGVLALDNVSLKINKGSKVVIVGKSGSGKTTLLDILSGLISPDRGSVFIGKTKLDQSNSFLWQKQISYAPQNVFLLSGSVAKNIALHDSIDPKSEKKLRNCADMAHVTSIFEKSARSGLKEVIGDGGSGLSGGQAQRIGIARALYHDRQTVILDESISSIETITGRAIIEAVLNANPNKTVIMVTHNLDLIELFDRVILLEAGKIIADGPYDNLKLESDSLGMIFSR